MRLLGTMLAIALAGCGGGASHVVEGVRIAEDEPGLFARASVPADSAIALATRRVPGGRVAKGELEEEGGRLVYSFDVKVPGEQGVEEVQVDAVTGEIVAVVHEDD